MEAVIVRHENTALEFDFYQSYWVNLADLPI